MTITHYELIAKLEGLKGIVDELGIGGLCILNDELYQPDIEGCLSLMISAIKDFTKWASYTPKEKELWKDEKKEKAHIALSDKETEQ